MALLEMALAVLWWLLASVLAALLVWVVAMAAQATVCLMLEAALAFYWHGVLAASAALAFTLAALADAQVLCEH